MSGMPLGRAHAPHGPMAAARWRLCSHLGLGALPSAVPCARLNARQVIWEWGLTGLSESIELVVSELVTNAIHASRGLTRCPVVRLWLLADDSRVLVLVWDANPRPPTRLDTDDEAESGRGLILVESVSDRWNWFQPEDMDGKIVWAELVLHQ